MKHLQQDFLEFLGDLEENNNRDWFQKNKRRYEESVKKPFQEFVNELLQEMAPLMPGLDLMEPKHCIFRIYRDIRFSKDKTPYKTHVSAALSPGGKKEMTKPSMYIQFSAGDARLYSGCYRLDKQQLAAIRSNIAYDIPAFQKLIKDKKFKSHFGEIVGDKNKRLPKDFVEAAKEEPLLFNKQFYYFKTYSASQILKSNFSKTLRKDYEILAPLNQFMNEGLEDAAGISDLVN